MTFDREHFWRPTFLGQWIENVSQFHPQGLMAGWNWLWAYMFADFRDHKATDPMSWEAIIAVGRRAHWFVYNALLEEDDGVIGPFSPWRDQMRMLRRAAFQSVRGFVTATCNDPVKSLKSGLRPEQLAEMDALVDELASLWSSEDPDGW